MTDANNHMDKIFRDKLGDFQEQPPEEIWNGIKAGLNDKPRRIILIPLWQAAAGMALLITAGSIFFYLNRPVQNRLADEFSIVPQNIQAPSTLDKTVLPENQNEILTNSKPGEKQENNLGSVEPVEEKSSLIHMAEAEKLIITENSNDVTRDDYNTEPGFTYRLSPDFMPDAYLQSVKQDEIPRNKKSVTASWDMLTPSSNSDNEEEVINDRLLLTAQVSPTYSYRDIGNIGSTGSGQFNQYESGKISYSGGLQFGYKTTERLSIHTGLMYAQLGYNVNQVGSFNVSKSNAETDVLAAPEKVSTVYAAKNSIGTIGSTSATEDFIGSNSNRNNSQDFYSNLPLGVSPNLDVQSVGKIEQYFQYLEIPFLLRYRIFDHKLGVNLLGGVSTNILVGNRAILTTDEQSSNIGASGDIRYFNYMGNMGLGFDYNIGKNLLFIMEPQFKYFLNSINQSKLISNRPYMLGMFTGIKFIW